jgi:DNA repair protein RadC
MRKMENNQFQVFDHAVEYGMISLSDSEVLAMATGISLNIIKNVFKEIDQDIHVLKTMSIDDIMQLAQIGRKSAIKIKSAMMLSFRVNSPLMLKNKITCSKDIYKQIRPYFMGHVIEQFYVMALSRSNKIIKIKMMSSGGTAGTVVDTKVIFKWLLSVNAQCFIVAHNHPSNQIFPSKQDLTVTDRIVRSGNDLDLVLLDHLIIGEESFYSFADNGRL